MNGILCLPAEWHLIPSFYFPLSTIGGYFEIEILVSIKSMITPIPNKINYSLFEHMDLVINLAVTPCVVTTK